MENKELKTSIPEELNEEDLSMVTGAIVTTVPPDSLCHLRCDICRKLKRVDQFSNYSTDLPLKFLEERVCTDCSQST